MWWGFSPALNLINELGEDQQPEDANKTCNVLLIGQFDGRHVLKTIAEKYKQKQDISLNFYVHEPLLENTARELLFTTLALEPPENLGIAEKTQFFLELYGNTLIRPATSKYLNKVSKRMLNMITDFDYAQQILPYVSFEYLKYKERDQLEVIFKYWASDNSFDILSAWDKRLRQHLGVRYDSRNGVYDWNYHMRYHNYCDVLRLPEYKKFREKGVAFHFEDTDPCIPNRTLESAIFSAGSRIVSYGYMGDIITGPYPGFGFHCDDKDMYKKVNGQMLKSATQFTERNIMRIFYEIQHQAPFKAPSVEDETPVVLVDTSDSLKIQQTTSEFQIGIINECEMYKSLGTNNCKIIFTSTTALKDYSNKPEFDNHFDLVFIAQTLVSKLIKPDMFKMLKPLAKIVVDTPKYLLNYRNEDLETYKKDLENLMKDCHCKLIKPFNYETEDFLKFILEK